MGRFFGSCGLVFRSYRVGATFTAALCSLPHQWDDRKGRPYATGIHLLFHANAIRISTPSLAISRASRYNDSMENIVEMR
jgi:hypothetical protein